MIIDVHGHYTTAPAALAPGATCRSRDSDPSKAPRASELKISDDEIRETIETNQPADEAARLRSHHLQPARQLHGAPHRRLRDIEHLGRHLQRAVLPRQPAVPRSLHPGRHAAAVARVDPKTCIPELVKCVEQYGNVGINLNPDPSGGHWTSPPLSDRSWYPIYEKMVEYDIPAMVHVSTSCNACFHTTGAHYLNADTTAFMQCLTSDLFKDFPTLKFLIPMAAVPCPTTGAVSAAWRRNSRSRCWTSTCSTTSSSTPASTTSRASIC